MRAYLATTVPMLAQALVDGHVVTGHVHAVTDDLRAEQLVVDPEVDDEELELIAMLDAARASLALLATAPTSPLRRLVLAVDVPDSALPQTDGEGARRTVVPISAVICAFVDEAAAEPAVRAALSALALDRPDDEVSAAFDAADEHDLLWYDATELNALAAELG